VKSILPPLNADGRRYGRRARPFFFSDMKDISLLPVMIIHEVM
jgi:hypothetical protein